MPVKAGIQGILQCIVWTPVFTGVTFEKNSYSIKKNALVVTYRKYTSAANARQSKSLLETVF